MAIEWGVFGWDSLVVEGWTSCFLLVVYVFYGKIFGFGKQVLSEM